MYTQILWHSKGGRYTCSEKKQFTEYCRIKSYHDYRRALKFIVYFLHLTLLKKLWTMDYCELGNRVSLKAKLL